MTRTVRLDVPLPAVVVFDYLSNPHRRPQWQASLRAVADVQGDGGVGTSWTDVTVLGVRPRLRVTAAERPRVWSESGRWRGLNAVLRLELLEYAPARTRLSAVFRVRGTAVFALAAPILERLAGPAIRADLSRAVRLAAHH